MSLQIQVTADVAGAGKQIEDFSKRSRIALNSLSLVAQDLPFGFIGIQNNLPGVISSFGDLTREAGSVGGALKQLGSSLIGPAGLFLAFSVVTSAVTFAIQKYGSFGAAVDALFGKINPLSKVIQDAAKSQEDFNESYKTTSQIIASATGSVDAQILKVQLLSDTVTNLNNSEQLRKNALSELKKIDKNYFDQITTGASDVLKLEEATRKYTDALLANAIAKGFEEKVTQASINLEEQRNLLSEISKGYDDIAKKRQGKQKEFVLFTGGKPIKETVLEAAKLNETFNKQKLVVDEAVKSVDKLKESFSNATLEALNFVEPVEKAGKALKGLKIGTIIDSGELGPGILVDTLEAFQAYVRGNINIQKNSIDKILTARLDYRRKELEENFLLPKKLDKNAGPLNKNPLIEFQFGQITAIIDALKQEAKFIDEAFREPLENLFVDFLQKGKLSFEDFTKSVINNITQLVAKLAASKLFEALASLIPQIAGTLLPGGTELTQIAKFLGSGRSIFGTANFGGVGGGGMNLNGQVVFVQRGADLVGVMNRTNAQIQRIG